MRRAVVAVIIGGYAFWGIGSGLGHQPVIAGARLTAAVKPAKAGEPASQTVTFGGYTVSVPASWPVYDLTKNPRQCVRYDVHAVYLGTPGPNPDCPPSLIGRVDTVTIQAPGASAGTKTAGNSKGPRRAASAGSAITDLQSNTTVAGHSLAEPQAIWFALWDLAEHRRRLGGQRGRAEVTAGSPIRTGRIQFAMTGPDS